MGKQKVKSEVKKPKTKPEEVKEELEDENDFGGLPEDIDLRKNIGCGG